MKTEHKVIFVPGMDGKVGGIKVATVLWPLLGLKPIMFPMVWRDQEPLQAKLDPLLELVDTLISQGHVVSGVGTSAGGSLMFNAFIQRQEVMNKVVSVCSRLTRGPLEGERGFSKRTKSSTSFPMAVGLLQDSLPTLTRTTKDKMMTVRALGFDELVSPVTAELDGVRRYRVPSAEHLLSIGLALSFFSLPIIRFLKQRSRNELG